MNYDEVKEQDNKKTLCLPEDVEHQAGCQSSEHCSPKPQDLYIKKTQLPTLNHSEFCKAQYDYIIMKEYQWNSIPINIE